MSYEVNENKGYVKVYRDNVNHPLFRDERLLKLYFLCIMKASYKHKSISIDGITKDISILPGQLITGRFQLYRDTAKTQEVIPCAS